MATRPHARKQSGAYFKPETVPTIGQPVTRPYRPSEEMIRALNRANKYQQPFGVK